MSSIAKKGTTDKLMKATMSKKMLAAGLAAAAAAISASPSARKKIRDAGLDAADTASNAASSMILSATKLGSLIAEAVADAAQRILSGDLSVGKSDAGGEDVSQHHKRRVAAKKTVRTKSTVARSSLTQKKGRRKPASKASKVTLDRPIPPSKPGR